MNDDNLLGGVLDQLGQTAKKTVQQVVKLPAASAESSGPLRSEASEPKEPARNATQSVAGGEKKQQWQSDQERVRFLRGLYGSVQSSVETSASAKASTDAKAMADKSADKPEEQKKLMELRNKLHKEVYYDPTFNPVKNPPVGGEERPAEKVEQEKKQEMAELAKKEEKKPPPLAVARAAQRVENLPGAG